jgi:dCMP deaminase
MKRRDKENYYLDMAQTASERSTCLRRHFGAIIVKNDVIVSTGYAGAPRGRQNCCDRGECLRKKLGIPSGERYELCRSVHAEANAIIAPNRDELLDSTLYLACVDAETGEITKATEPCSMCKRLIINAGIKEVVIRDTIDQYRIIKVSDWIENDDSLGNHSGY